METLVESMIDFRLATDELMWVSHWLILDLQHIEFAYFKFQYLYNGNLCKLELYILELWYVEVHIKPWFRWVLDSVFFQCIIVIATYTHNWWITSTHNPNSIILWYPLWLEHDLGKCILILQWKIHVLFHSLSVWKWTWSHNHSKKIYSQMAQDIHDKILGRKTFMQ